MKKAYVPGSEEELVVLRSIFEGEGVPCYVQNDNFGSLYATGLMHSFNQKAMYVSDQDERKARKIIEDYLAKDGREISAPPIEEPVGQSNTWRRNPEIRLLLVVIFLLMCLVLIRFVV